MIMKTFLRKTAYFLCTSAIVLPAMAQDISTKTHSLGEVTVTTRRPLKEIGIQKTMFDSLALKENISLSMADVLAYNSSVFVKSYGRATLSTVAFRGTSASHTQVSWNGMRINNPMLAFLLSPLASSPHRPIANNQSDNRP